MHAPTHITIEARARRRTPGFSLIELVLVMTIIAVLSAIAVPRYADALARYRADAAANKIVADLGYARKLARSTSTSVSVRINPNMDQLRLIDIPDPDFPGRLHTTTELWNRPYHAKVTSSNFGGDLKIIFDGYGVPDSGGTAVLTVGSETRTIVLDPDTGKAVVQ
jgi:prepilin-type N-terminal cleavage/methylation domain-containing protein